jgi:hypothetical protein
VNTLRATEIGEARLAAAWDRAEAVQGNEVTRGPFKILGDGNPHRIPRMGTLSGFGTPLFLPAIPQRQRDRPPLWGRDRRASFELR